MARKLAIFGSTGSIGRNTLSVLRATPGLDIEVYALTCGSNWQELAEQTNEFHPRRVVIADIEAAGAFKEAVGRTNLRVDTGEDGLLSLAADPAIEIVTMAIVGSAALLPALACLDAGKVVALVNKECLAMAGHIIMARDGKNGAKILPVDSEHAAALQLLLGEERASIKRLIITSSGGSLRNMPLDALDQITPEMALAHPTWRMGRKVTIDSATSVNKALELVEAHWLFNLPADALEVWVHRQSRVHALVEFVDGATTIFAALNDMRLPIQYALTYPRRLASPVMSLNMQEINGFTFEEPDPRRLPALPLGYRVIREGGTLGAVMNAANETAVHAFLDHQIPFIRIVAVIEEVMDAHQNAAEPSLDDVLAADAWARKETLRRLGLLV